MYLRNVFTLIANIHFMVWSARTLNTLLRCYTIWTTRCRFVNVVFGFAARKVSRHRLHKHVNAHVYLGVWRITLNSVQAAVGEPHDHVDKPFCAAQLSYSQIWEVQIGSCESRISWYSGSGSTYSRLHLFRVRWKVAFGCGWQRQV